MKYVSRARTEDDDWYGMSPRTMTVHVTDGDPVDTGLVDHLGVPIMRLSERIPMGFKSE